jgi:hypothetical protein
LFVTAQMAVYDPLGGVAHIDWVLMRLAATIFPAA